MYKNPRKDNFLSELGKTLNAESEMVVEWKTKIESSLSFNDDLEMGDGLEVYVSLKNVK